LPRKEKFNQEEIWVLPKEFFFVNMEVLPRDKILAKKIYEFCQERKVYLRKNINFAKRKKFNQE
jgi:hypothetical protein